MNDWKCRFRLLIVQTLVENAVKHGIAELPRGGTITIQALYSERELEICILNTGQIAKHYPREGQNIGVMNTRERLSVALW